MKHLKNRTSGDPESIKLFKKSVYSDENFNLFVVNYSMFICVNY